MHDKGIQNLLLFKNNIFIMELQQKYDVLLAILNWYGPANNVIETAQ